jgi:hypothetical protein
MRKFLVGACLLFAVHLLAQDTLQLAPPVIYYPDSITPFRKGSGPLELAPELITYTPTKVRLEYCYYSNGKRIASGNSYTLLSDSTLLEDLQLWHYEKRGSQYFMYRCDAHFYECGYAQTLLPLKKVGKFYTLNAAQKDTLWITDYTNYKPTQRYSRPELIFISTAGNKKVYTDSDKIQQPTLANGDSIPKLKVERSEGFKICISEPYFYAVTIQFIVTAEGNVICPKAITGYIHSDSCPYPMIDTLTALYKLGPLKPALLNGKPVNYLITIEVEKFY